MYFETFLRTAFLKNSFSEEHLPVTNSSTSDTREFHSHFKEFFDSRKIVKRKKCIKLYHNRLYRAHLEPCQTSKTKL